MFSLLENGWLLLRPAGDDLKKSGKRPDGSTPVLASQTPGWDIGKVRNKQPGICWHAGGNGFEKAVCGDAGYIEVPQATEKENLGGGLGASKPIKEHTPLLPPCCRCWLKKTGTHGRGPVGS